MDRDSRGRLLPGRKGPRGGRPPKAKLEAKRQAQLDDYLERLAAAQEPLGSAHRDAKGRWVKGKPPGPGRPPRLAKQWLRAQELAPELAALVEWMRAGPRGHPDDEESDDD